jgi:hypothetical protein
MMMTFFSCFFIHELSVDIFSGFTDHGHGVFLWFLSRTAMTLTKKVE